MKRRTIATDFKDKKLVRTRCDRCDTDIFEVFYKRGRKKEYVCCDDCKEDMKQLDMELKNEKR